MRKHIFIITALFITGTFGCKKTYLDLENNPNSPSSATPQLLLSGALNNSAWIISGALTVDYVNYGVWDGYWTTSGNYVPNQAINQYQITNQTFNSDWNDWYSNLYNYNLIQSESASDPNLANFQAIAMIMKAYGFQYLVDQYNDVPYTQAFQPTKILEPAYDKGIDIYHDLGKQLDAAIALINKNTSASTPGSSDIVFNGDMSSWKKFANTLKLRLAIRLSTKFPSDPLITDLASTESEGYLDKNGAQANPGYQQILGKQSPFWGIYGLDVNGNPTFPNTYYRANAFAVNILKAFNDPRLTEFYATVPTSGTDPTPIVHGNVFGDTKATLLSNTYTSAIGPGLLKSPSQFAILLSGAECFFLQAEAANDGFITGNAQALYQSGITASFEQLGLTDAQAQAYYSQNIPNVSWTNSPDKEKAIITQKWIALNGLFNFEAWNDYRRTGIPALPSSIDPAAISPTLPTRMLYPITELQTNAANLAKEGTINPFTSKIFWAQ
ncbi:MAG TPA: SusD/RagB family nutrient-binding outer membrane lipoprotein [Mucilaginibacter sp.]|nr:SusD/RagB family nutrient-binding outer membrane lipoprotein [Mucilaginibacter sp.]